MGMPNRTDTARYSPTIWPWLEEIASVTNALMGLVKVEKESGTGLLKDVLADECVRMWCL